MKSILGIIIGFALLGCTPSGSLRQLLELESWKGSAPTPEREAQVEKELKAVQSDLDQLIDRTQYKGTLLKSAALYFLEARMYGPALEYLLQAMAIQTASPSLYYYAGLAESNLAKIQSDPDKVIAQMNRAANYHKRALELDSGFVEAYYALGVIYGLELNQPEEGLKWVNQYLELQNGLVRGEKSSGRTYRPQRLKASLLLALGRTKEALVVYRDILKYSKDPEDISLAEDRIKELGN